MVLKMELNTVYFNKIKVRIYKMSLQQTVVSFYSNMYWYSLYKVVFFIMAAVVYGTSEEYFTVMQSP